MKKIQWRGSLKLLLAAQVLAVGCGPAQEFHAPPALSSQTHEIRIANGISTNGLSTNGLSTNGLVRGRGVSVDRAVRQWDDA